LLNNSLSGFAGLENGQPVSETVIATLNELQMSAYAGMSFISDALNTSVGGKYIFGAGSSAAPTQFNFNNLEEFQNYYDGVNVKYPTTSNASLSSRNVNWETSGTLNITAVDRDDPLNNNYVLSSTGGFLNTAVVGGSETTGNLTLSYIHNTLKAENYGAFNAISAGDTLVLNDGNTTKAYIVESVSEDGKTITFSQETKIEDDGNFDADGNKVFTDGINADNGEAVTLSTSFAKGTVLNFNDITNPDFPPMQVEGIDTNGNLIVTANKKMPDGEYDISTKWSLTSESYYQGGSATEVFRISDNQKITFDVSANDSVFDRLFRSMGMIAQGNIIKYDDDGNVANAQEVKDWVNQAMDVLQSAFDNNGKATSGKNETLSLVIAKVSSNYVILDNVKSTLESVQGNLENSIYEIKNVDQTEATVKLLQAQSSLEASYNVLSNVLNNSLLNYLK
ncbi:MAG: hypothetical protein IKA30_01390, partial [Alphaproteobacteria bacterium]|nr:hypothetical protein [Alphaproteobacteria bacterium]